MIGLVLLGASALGAGGATYASPQLRLAGLELELEGPLSGLAVDFRPFSRAELDLALVAGERRRLLLPMPVPAQGAVPEPRLAPEGAGAARALGWSEAPRALPAALEARPLPPVAARGARARPSAWALLALSLAAVWSLRRRPILALGVGAAGGLGLALLGAAASGAAEVRVLDGDGGVGGSGRWCATDGALGSLSLEDSIGAYLESSPPGRALVVRGPGPAPERPAFRLEAGAETVLWARRAFDPGERAFRRPSEASDPRALRNEWGSVGAAWHRDPDGVWSGGGPWAVGTTLAEVETRGGEPPPGWLASGLPPGVEVLLARLPAERPGGRVSWLRLVRPAGS